MSKKFWGEAINTAAYLVNRSPSIPLKGECPESVFWGKPVNISHLKVFGYSSFVDSKTFKLEPRSRKCIFLGYLDGVKGYRVWLRDEPGFRVTVSRDVIFNESEFPCLVDSIGSNPKETSNEVKPTSNEVEFTSNEVEGTTPPEFVQTDNFCRMTQRLLLKFLKLILLRLKILIIMTHLILLLFPLTMSWPGIEQGEQM